MTTLCIVPGAVEATARMLGNIEREICATDESKIEARIAAKEGPINPNFAHHQDQAYAREMTVELATRAHSYDLKRLDDAREAAEALIDNSEAGNLVEVLIQANRVHTLAWSVQDRLPDSCNDEAADLERVKRLAMSMIRLLVRETGADLTAYGILRSWLEENSLLPTSPSIAAE